MSNYKTLPDTGFVRLTSIIAPSGPIPVSKSTWWQGVKDGRFPKPVKLGAKDRLAGRRHPRTDRASGTLICGKSTTLDPTGQTAAHLQRKGGRKGDGCDGGYSPPLAQGRAAACP